MANKDCLEMGNESRILCATIIRRLTSFFGHAIRKEASENIVRLQRSIVEETKVDHGKLFWMVLNDGMEEYS